MKNQEYSRYFWRKELLGKGSLACVKSGFTMKALGIQCDRSNINPHSRTLSRLYRRNFIHGIYKILIWQIDMSDQ